MRKYKLKGSAWEADAPEWLSVQEERVDTNVQMEFHVIECDCSCVALFVTEYVPGSLQSTAVLECPNCTVTAHVNKETDEDGITGRLLETWQQSVPTNINDMAQDTEEIERLEGAVARLSSDMTAERRNNRLLKEEVDRLRAANLALIPMDGILSNASDRHNDYETYKLQMEYLVSQDLLLDHVDDTAMKEIANALAEKVKQQVLEAFMQKKIEAGKKTKLFGGPIKNRTAHPAAESPFGPGLSDETIAIQKKIEELPNKEDLLQKLVGKDQNDVTAFIDALLGGPKKP